MGERKRRRKRKQKKTKWKEEEEKKSMGVVDEGMREARVFFPRENSSPKKKLCAGRTNEPT